jgi:thioredoxin reductase (NADPH)
MAKPTILAVDDDPGASRAIARDLTSRYGADYTVVRATSGAEALAQLDRLELQDRRVALVVTDQRMPGMTGIEMLEEVRRRSPDSKLLLLTAYADTDVAIKAINDIGLDYYLVKPWDPPSERLYPVLDDLLNDWSADHPPETQEVRVVGHPWADHTYEVKTFLTRNHVPYRWLDVERDEEARKLLQLAGFGDVDPEQLPVVVMPSGTALPAPSNLELAGALGLRTQAQQPLYDLCIVGSGPAGLAAAVYAASEGLSTVIVERDAPGGQAGQSASIENYLGFPRGLSGADLTHRAVAQAARFGAETVLARDVVRFESRGPVRAVILNGGDAIEARALLVATGVSYRRLEAPGIERLTGKGVYYGSSAADAGQCEGQDVYVVGAANSAGQAVLNFASHAKRVIMLVRESGLEATMSMYLIQRIRRAENVEVRLRTEVVGAHGNHHLERLTLADRAGGRQEDVDASWLFAFIGASPHTDWLGDAVERDARGYIVTGRDLHSRQGSTPARPPFALETSVPGVFAAGDVRLDSMKRVASAVGEGAMAVHLVHRYLATT